VSTPRPLRTFTAFLGERRVAGGAIDEVALAGKSASAASPDETLLFFDDQTGEAVDLDLRGTATQVRARLAQGFGEIPSEAEASPGGPDDGPASKPGRGRPKLGVVAREVTLLPRHWEWLGQQPGSASVTLRRLVEEARRSHAARDRRRQAQKASYLFMSAMAGDRPNFEEATRALFAGDERRFVELLQAWPADIRAHAERLAQGAFGSTASPSD
jgi:hypothetical protein